MIQRITIRISRRCGNKTLNLKHFAVETQLFRNVSNFEEKKNTQKQQDENQKNIKNNKSCQIIFSRNKNKQKNTHTHKYLSVCVFFKM